MWLYFRDTRSLQTCVQPVLNKTLQQSTETAGNCVKIGVNQPALQGKIQPLYNHESIRTIIKHFYRPSSWRRIHKHGLEKRLSCPSQRAILFRGILKNRQTLCVTDRFMNKVYEKKQKGKRVSLFDPKIRQKVKKYNNVEYYKFDDYKKVFTNW